MIQNKNKVNFHALIQQHAPFEPSEKTFLAADSRKSGQLFTRQILITMRYGCYCAFREPVPCDSRVFNNLEWLHPAMVALNPSNTFERFKHSSIIIFRPSIFISTVNRNYKSRFFIESQVGTVLTVTILGFLTHRVKPVPYYWGSAVWSSVHLSVCLLPGGLINRDS